MSVRVLYDKAYYIYALTCRQVNAVQAQILTVRREPAYVR